MAEGQSLSPWSPLRVALFRSLWLAALVSNLGTYMHYVAAGWAITTLTRSPTQVSLLQAAGTVPGFLVALLAGALADVVDRRRLIVITQACSVVIAGALGLSTQTGHLTVPLLLALTFALSTVATVAAPAFMAVTPELVSPSELPKALGLNSVAINIAQSLGPALAGLVIATSGPGVVFLINAASFFGIIVVFRSYSPPTDATMPAQQMIAAIRTGVRFFAGSSRLQVLAARVALAMTTGSALTALLPIIARTRFDASAAEFGLLATASGLGAVAAVWSLPLLSRLASPDVLAAVAAVVWASGVVALVATRMLLLALVGLMLTGAGSMVAMNIVFSMYTVLLPSWVRGRASSVAMLVIWLGASVGAVGWGALASTVGVRSAMVVAAAVHVAVTALASKFLPLGSRAVADSRTRPHRA